MFSSRVEEALRVALYAHSGQVRKGAVSVPYVSHPMHVALMLARFGHGDTVIQAALLHDVVEDCEEWTVERVRERFGPTVAGIVTEVTEDKTRSWEERKQSAIDSVYRLSNEAAAVKAVDQLHNLATLAEDLEAADDGQAVWQRFRGGREKTLVMSTRLVEALERRIDPRMARELRRALEQLLALESPSPRA